MLDESSDAVKRHVLVLLGENSLVISIDWKLGVAHPPELSQGQRTTNLEKVKSLDIILRTTA